MAHNVSSEEMPKINAKEFATLIEVLLLFDPFNPKYRKINALYVIGKRGTGKTEIIRKVVEEMNIKEKDVHYVLVEQTLNKYYDAPDFIGHSFIDVEKKEMVSAYPYLLRETENQIKNYILQTNKIDSNQKEKLLNELNEIQKENDKQKRAEKLNEFCKKNKICVTYFLDEVSAVPPQIIEPIARFVREGKLGDCVVPYGYKVILAGNYSEEMGDLDYRHPLMLMDRMTILYYELTLEEFLTYSQKSPNFHPALIAFLTHYPEFFLQYNNQFATSPRRIEDVSSCIFKLEEYKKQKRISDVKFNIALKKILSGNFPSQIADSFYAFYTTTYNQALDFIQQIEKEFIQGEIQGQNLSSLSDKKLKEMALSILFYLKKENFHLTAERLPLYIASIIGMYYLLGLMQEKGFFAGVSEVIASLYSITLKEELTDKMNAVITSLQHNKIEQDLQNYIKQKLYKNEKITYEKIKSLFFLNPQKEKESKEFFYVLNEAQSLEPGSLLILSEALEKLVELAQTYIQSDYFKEYVEKGNDIFKKEIEKITKILFPPERVELLSSITSHKTTSHDNLQTDNFYKNTFYKTTSNEQIKRRRM
ncbi:MAG: hypothetical protein QW067_07640 [Thermofilaceae archaeon]